MIHEERFSTTTWSQHKFVSVGGDSLFHRQIGNVQMHWFSADTIHHFYSKRAGRIPVVGFFGKKAQCLFNEGEKRFFRWKVSFISRNSRPIKSRTIHCIVTWR